MKELMQSGAGMLDMLTNRPAARTWLVRCPPGMLAQGHQVKKFTSVDAFDGYVREVRAQGYTVSFASPFTAIVEART